MVSVLPAGGFEEGWAAGPGSSAGVGRGGSFGAASVGIGSPLVTVDAT